ncbi:DUF1987 domain-containing protein [Flammeovirga kamogawensis]|uniref:DUF1987 domain-containing protein n=1 Tax=Flammeovirga kamogawensis TaxID=373891 RepID=A0ABX8GYC2_9BACT|nr:DUF1987 domain-containing protein [Flammeovirga kamogawensis]MBB6462795.1 hypothetical protein [Flammeovirga kamogawensis]QWG08419.1 DUF1987 domain-containing protein [Flammeovirga kamogawensis]TRX66715.1 DUF1987 domain-containing protein [Flammeovirga kamogawensis]
MDKLFIKKKEFVPEVNFEPAKGLLEISGQSYHEYTAEFFEPLFEWVGKYLEESGHDITLNYKMTYFNTASSKSFFQIIEMLQAYEESGKGKAIVNWYYKKDDEDMLETGEDFISDSGWKNIHLIGY